MALPDWSQPFASPAAFGTDAAREAGQRPQEAAAPAQDGKPDWTQNFAEGIETGGQDGAVNWAATTGQNPAGANNAFDTAFWDMATRQDEEQAQRGMTDRWTRPDATGVAVYNDEDQGVRFGDVYLNGQKQGNLREGYAGMDQQASNQLLARLTLPRETWERAYRSENGEPLQFIAQGEEGEGPLAGELDRVEVENTQNYLKGKSAAEFQAGRQERTEELQESEGAQVANVAAGIAGGATTGAGAGAIAGSWTGPGAAVTSLIGAGIGGLAGGIGAWLNRDQQLQGIATAAEMWEQANDDGHQFIGAADAASGVVGVLSQYLQPTTNLYRGGREALQGLDGDSQVQRQTEEQGLAANVADTAFLAADSIGSFGSKAATRVYTSLMGATAATQQASVAGGFASGNIAFNPYSGSYEDIGLTGMAQRQLSVGIDAAQTFAGAGVVRTFDGGTRAMGGFKMRTLADGTTGARGMSISAAIPSEAATGISARMFARRSLRRQGIEAQGDDLARETARYIDNLTTGRSTIATAVVNGFGEGAEEAVQAVLGATAFGETPTFNEVFDAARQGFAMGIGMGVATGRNATTASQQFKMRSDVLRQLHQQEAYTPESWDAMTTSQQAQAGTPQTVSEQRIIDNTVKQLRLEAGAKALRSVPETARVQEVARTVAEREAGNSQRSVERSRMQVLSNPDWAPQDMVVSLNSATDDIRARMGAMERVLAGEPVVGESGQPLNLGDEERARVQLVLNADQQTLNLLTQARMAFDRAATPEEQNRIIGRVNGALRQMWHAPRDSDEGYGQRRSASVIGARYPFNSGGSTQLLRLQVSPNLTRQGADDTVQISDDTIVPQGGDFDGDRTSNLIRSFLTDEAYDGLRYGAGQLGAKGTMLDVKPNVAKMVKNVANSLAKPVGAEYSAATRALTKISARVTALLKRSEIPAEQRDALVSRLMTGLHNDNPDRVKDFLDTLATRHATAMRVLGETTDDSPYLRLIRIVEDGLREYSTESALREEQPPSTLVDLPETSQQMPQRDYRALPHTSAMLSAVSELDSTSAFRAQTALKYNEARERDDQDSADILQPTLMDELVETFVTLNDRLPVMGTDALDVTTAGQSKTYEWLQRMAGETMRDQALNKPYDLAETMVVLSGTDVSRPGLGEQTLLQRVLEEVVTAQQRSDRTGDETAQRRYQSLLRLTQPGRDEDGQSIQNAGNAFVEVFGSMPIDLLLGDRGAALMPYGSVRGLRDKLIELRSSKVKGARDTRAEFIAAMRDHPDWKILEDGTKTPYRVLVDQVVQSANMQLSEKDGLAQGLLAAPSNRASAQVRDLHYTVRKLANGRGTPLHSPAQAKQFLMDDPRMARALFAMMDERGLAKDIGVMQGQDGSTQFDYPDWMYFMLAEPRSDLAEMILLRENLFSLNRAQGKADGDFTKLDVLRQPDRLLRLWTELRFKANDAGNENQLTDDQALKDFVAALTDPDATVESFIRTLNTDTRFRTETTPPFMAWVRDTSTVRADRYGKGVSEQLDSTTMRDAIKDAADQARFALHQDESSRQWLTDANNTNLIGQLRDGRDNPDSAHRQLWQNFVTWVEFARDLPTLVGASLWIEQASKVNEIVSNMGVKGISPENVAPMGEAIAAQIAVFDSAAGRLFASASSGSIAEVLADATLLQKERTIVTQDGTVVDWAGVSPDQALELLADESTMGIAARSLGLTAFDYNPESGTNTLSSVYGRGVAALATDPQQVLFANSTTSKLRRLMVLEGMASGAGGEPTIPVYLAQQMNVREAALDHVIDPGSPERTNMAVHILEDLADTLDELSSIQGQYYDNSPDASHQTTVEDPDNEGERISLLNLSLRAAAKKARTEHGGGNPISKILSQNETLRTAQEMALQTGIAQMAAANTDNPVALAMAKRLKRWLETSDSASNPLDFLINSYSDFTDPAVQATLLDHLNSFPEIRVATPWAADAIDIARSPRTVTRDLPAFPNNSVAVPDMKPEMWETLARAVIAYSLHRDFGLKTDSNLQLAEFPSLVKNSKLLAERPMWDPTFVEMGVNMFAPGVEKNPDAAPSPLMQAQMELRAQLGPRTSLNTTREKAAGALDRFVAPQRTDPNTGITSGVVGPWHGLMPAMIHTGVGAVMSGASESGTQMAGIGPERIRFLAAGTVQDWDRQPPDTELSSTQIGADVLITAVGQNQTLDTSMDVTFPDSRTGGRAIAQLEGRVVRSITITLPDGQEAPVSADPRYASGLRIRRGDDLPAEQGGIVSLDNLSDSITSLLRDRGVRTDQFSNATVNIQFFHPETKVDSQTRVDGAVYDHNPWFDGVVGGTERVFNQPSLVGQFFMGLDGQIPIAYDASLGAVKKLKFALQQVTTMPEQARKAAVAKGNNGGMAEMLHDMTKFIITQDVDGETIGLENYNAVYKVLSLMYVVRHVDNGVPVVLSAEQVIARQARGEPFEDSEFAEVVGLPMSHVLGLMGERSAAVPATTVLQDESYNINVSRARAYLNFPAEAWTDAMFGGMLRTETDDQGNVLGWATTDLLRDPQLRNLSTPTSRQWDDVSRRKESGKDRYSGFARERQAKIHDERASNRGYDALAAQRTTADRYALQNPNIGQEVLRQAQMIARGEALEAAQMLTPPRNVATQYDLSTSWYYTHRNPGQRAGLDTGMLASDQLERVALGDTVHVAASEFMQDRDNRSTDEVMRDARLVLQTLMGFGATISLPPENVGQELRGRMVQYLRSNGYAEEQGARGIFEPSAATGKTRAEDAFAARLRAPKKTSLQNRVFGLLSPMFPANENSAFSVNGGFGAMNDYIVSETVQTQRYSGYGPVQPLKNGAKQDDQRAETIRTLKNLLSSRTGREYLENLSWYGKEEPKTTDERHQREQEELDLTRALDDFLDRLQAADNDPTVSLLPRDGDEFGTGDIIPLVSYNEARELTGIQLVRHGHEPVPEELMTAQWPPGNAQLAAGVRITMDLATVDAEHTTHRGVVRTNPQWSAAQGFTMRMAVKLGDLGSKAFEALTGMKWTSTDAPEGMPVPSHNQLGGKPVLLAADEKSPLSKDSTGSWLNRTETIVEAIGFDTMPPIIRAIYGSDAAPLGSDRWNGQRADVLNILSQYRQKTVGMVDPMDVIDRSTTEVENALREFVNTVLAEMVAEGDGEFDSLDGLTLDVDSTTPVSQAADLRILHAVLTSLSSGARVEEVHQAPGFVGPSKYSHTMHPVLTTMIDQSWAARSEVVSQVNARMPRGGRTGEDVLELHEDYTWTSHVRTDAGYSHIPVTPVFSEIHNTAHNDLLTQQSLARKQKADASSTAMAVQATAWGTTPMLEAPFTEAAKVFARDPQLEAREGRLQLAFGVGSKTKIANVRYDDDIRLNQADEQHLHTEALPAARSLWEPLPTERWYEDDTPPKKAERERAYQGRFDTALRKLHLSDSPEMLEWMIRAAAGRGGNVVEGQDRDYITYTDAMASLKLIQANADRGLLPTRGGAVGTLPLRILRTLHENGYDLRRSAAKGVKPPKNWDEWVDILLVNTFSDDPQLRGYPAVSNMIDGVMYEYRQQVKGLDVTVNSELKKVLDVAKSRSGLLYASPIRRRASDFPGAEAGRAVHSTMQYGQADWVIEDLPTEARQIIENRMASWEKNNGLDKRKRQTPLAEARRGAKVREDLAATNKLVRMIQTGYVLKTFVNPGLWMGAFLELGIRGLQETVVSALSGESARTSGLNTQQREQWRDARDALSKSSIFYRLVYENTNYRESGAQSELEGRLQRATNFTSALVNDPTWGTRATTMANRFMEAAWSAYSAMPLERQVPIEQFLDIMMTNPEQLERIAPGALNQGFRRVEYARGLQDNMMSMTVRKGVEGAIAKSGQGALNTFGALALRLPTMFFRFRSNTIINMMGLQGPHATITALLSDRTKRAGGLKDHLGNEEVSQQAMLEDSMDLTRSIIRSGVSHTQLFILGSLVSASGLAGEEDDESKLLDKLRRYQETPVAKDPLSLENDFRNAEAWFTDMVPGGMLMPSWVMKMFTNPVMGIARYNETGDFRQVMWGFMDALGSMPLLNLDSVLNSWGTANDLAAAAEDESRGESEEAWSRAQKLLVTSLGTMESMLFESAFFSMLYQASDEYDRDPYAIPLRDSDGDIQRLGPSQTPRETDSLVTFQDPETGETRQGYAGRSGMDATIRGMAEGRPILASVLTLIKQDSTYLRNNMVPKTREVDSQELTDDEAELLAMSVLNNETGREEPTVDGGEAVIRGIHVGSLSADSPALNGFYIPDDQRYEIQKRFLGQMTEEYLTKGYSKSDALSAAQEDYYGQAYGEPEATGLADILWGNAIPRYESQEYLQLNTTYVMGPNGRPVATGLQRNMLATIGILPADTYHSGDSSNIGVDELLNSVDEGRGINLGWRGLERVDKSWEVPTDEEIGESITDALGEISEQLDDIVDAEGQGWTDYGNGWRNFGRGGWGSGGGYGYSSGGYGGSSYIESWGGSEQYLRAPRRISTPYADDLYSINTSNPIIRRSYVRRERYASQRGRLNQWT